MKRSGKMGRIKGKSVDLKKLKNAFTDMNNEKGIVGLALLEEIEFQKATLAKMREDIDNSSLIAQYSGYKRANPIIAGYNAMVKNYSMLIRQAVELLPDNVDVDITADDLMNEEF